MHFSKKSEGIDTPWELSLKHMQIIQRESENGHVKCTIDWNASCNTGALDALYTVFNTSVPPNRRAV